MGGGLMQLVAYGAQDIYLTGNPQITFFKVVYRRHTNFSMELIEQTWNGSSTGSNARCTATISRNGDLVNRMFLDVSGTPQAAESNPGSDWIKNIELEIGGQKIDKHSGKWMEVWSELTQENPNGTTGDTKAETAHALGTKFQRMSGMGGVISTTAAGRFWIPLHFWFCRNPGLALPLIALQYHEVKVILEHDFDDVFATRVHNRLWVDYIYLDTDERRRFAQVSHEYLIEQVQEQSLTVATGNKELNFNHPVKELVLACSTAAAGTANSTQLIKVGSTMGSTTLQLKLNGHDRFAVMPAAYFTRTQTWMYHTGSGLDSSGAATGSKFNDSIAVYSFALKPEEHQPSGTCNFSRIDNAQLVVGGANLSATPHIYAVNYNVLRIMSGMGGLAYSN
jgi:hypothetical protein